MVFKQTDNFCDLTIDKLLYEKYVEEKSILSN